MKISCPLSEFASRAKVLHAGYLNPKVFRRAEGIKRTRLLIRMRPSDSRKPLILKATDGNITISTRVQHVDDFPLLEQIITDFLTACTVKRVPH